VTSYITPRRRVQGSGSAHEGASTWLKERVSSIALIPLTIWGLCSAATISGGGFHDAAQWLRSPVNAVLLALTVLISLYHMQMGLRVVVEDYIHRLRTKGLLLLLNLFLCLALACTAVFAILKVALTGGVGA
jgi:succinate dehydrogenase / fumarate reductase membrane anchor subunit